MVQVITTVLIQSVEEQEVNHIILCRTKTRAEKYYAPNPVHHYRRKLNKAYYIVCPEPQEQELERQCIRQHFPTKQNKACYIVGP